MNYVKTMPSADRKKLNRLAENVDRRAKLPRGFAFYTPMMMELWLRAHQNKHPRPAKPAKRTRRSR